MYTTNQSCFGNPNLFRKQILNPLVLLLFFCISIVHCLVDSFSELDLKNDPSPLHRLGQEEGETPHSKDFKALMDIGKKKKNRGL